MFTPALKPHHNPDRPALWFIFHGGKLLIREKDGGAIIPFESDLAALGIAAGNKLFLGYYNGIPCWTAESDDAKAVPGGMSMKGLRSLYGLLPEDLFWVAGRAFQIKEWDRTHRFCSVCGEPVGDQKDERAKSCSRCGAVFYPRISPAVITAVTRGDEILLARSGRFPGAFYSVLAGFVEAGESLEECVHREIMEETGITVTDIRYFGSQPWPFPNSLMIGFTARHLSGEIVIDEKEIEDARWFRIGSLPEIPPGISIARKLIDWYVENHGK